MSSSSSTETPNTTNTAITSATDTDAGTLQAGIIQAASASGTTGSTTETNAKAASVISSSSASGTINTTSVKAIGTNPAANSHSSASFSSVLVVTSGSITVSQTKTSSTSSPSVSQSKGLGTSSAAFVSGSTSSIAQPVQATQNTGSLATSAVGSTAFQAISTGTVHGHLTTITTEVSAASSSTNVQLTPTALGSTSTESFLKNKAAVGGVFGAAGLLSLILLLAIVLKIVRYRSRRKFERDLDEQVEQEVRSGTPIFGLGKEDDGLSIMGGRAGGTSDPEKAAYANSGYGYPNTAAYPTYGGSIPPMATQPAYYSPDANNGALRRTPSRDRSQYREVELSRPDSRSSASSYGSLKRPPMNAFASPPAIPARNNAFAPAIFVANYIDHRHASPAPSTQYWQNRNQAAFSARPGTPSALTPGGRSNSTPAPPRNVYAPNNVKLDSPAVRARYTPSPSPRNSREGYDTHAYVGSQIMQVQIRNVGGLAAPARSKEPGSPNSPLPNPFDQRDH